MAAPAPVDRELRLPPLEGGPLEAGHLPGRRLPRALLLFPVLLAGTLAAATVIEVDEAVRAGGVVAPAGIHDVRLIESSTAVRVLVNVGDTVVEGQSVALLDARDRENELTDARSRLELLRTDIRRARAELDYDSERLWVALRQSSLRVDAADATLRGRLADLLITDSPRVVLERHVPGSAVMLDEAVAAYRQALVGHEAENARTAELRLDSLALARLVIEAARAEEQLKYAEDLLEQRTLRAPVAGVVLSDSILAPGNTFGVQGKLLFQIAQPGWIALLAIGERDADRVAPGQPVRLVLSAGDRALDGVVTRVAPVPVTSTAPQPEGPRYRVWARITGADRVPLRPGYTIEARIVIGSEPALHSLVRRLFNRSGRG
jgi:multidrug efflux pump subunit AcrA (membrane-fusion protein)